MSAFDDPLLDRRSAVLALSGAALSGAAVALAGGPLSPARAALPRVIDIMAKELGWDATRLEKERATAEERLGAAL